LWWFGVVKNSDEHDAGKGKYAAIARSDPTKRTTNLKKKKIGVKEQRELKEKNTNEPRNLGPFLPEFTLSGWGSCYRELC